jgi:dTDP-4-amino-4,6-dideoxygalactose transaminase
MSTRDDNEDVAATLVGGVFGLAPTAPGASTAAPPFSMDGAVLLASGRAAVRLLCEELRPPAVWLPSYLCPILLTAVQDIAAVRFYPQAADLRSCRGDWLDRIEPRELVVLVDYFGFPCDSEVAAAARNRGAWVVEDACQALLSTHLCRYADFVIYSPRKFVGVPDGGILTFRNGNRLPARTLPPAPGEWWLTAFSACRLRDEFERQGAESREWFGLYQMSEACTPCEAYGMSTLTQAILTHAVDYPRVTAARRRNYQQLCTALGDLAVFPELDLQTVPLGFPIRVSRREAVRQALFEQQVFPPIHWPLRGTVPDEFADSHRLAEEILTLPCDQRYDLETMDRMAAIVRRECEA